MILPFGRFLFTFENSSILRLSRFRKNSAVVLIALPKACGILEF
jgi:hypothetical protein